MIANIRLGQECLTVTNPLGYYTALFIMAVKLFMLQAVLPTLRAVLYKGLYKGRSALLSNVILGQKCQNSSLLHDIT